MVQTRSQAASSRTHMIITASLVAAIVALAVFLVVTHRVSFSEAVAAPAPAPVKPAVPVKEGFFSHLFGDIEEEL